MGFSTGPACLLLVGAVSSLPLPDGPGPHHPEGPLPIPRPGADGSYAGDAHFQYINVPAPGNFEWGYRRGNPDHNREEYLSQKDHAAPAYHAPKPAYGAGSENVASYVPAPAAPAEAMIFNISLLSRLVFLFASSPITMLQLCVIL